QAARASGELTRALNCVGPCRPGLTDAPVLAPVPPPAVTADGKIIRTYADRSVNRKWLLRSLGSPSLGLAETQVRQQRHHHQLGPQLLQPVEPSDSQVVADEADDPGHQRLVCRPR